MADFSTLFEDKRKLYIKDQTATSVKSYPHLYRRHKQFNLDSYLPTIHWRRSLAYFPRFSIFESNITFDWSSHRFNQSEGVLLSNLEKSAEVEKKNFL